MRAARPRACSAAMRAPRTPRRSLARRLRRRRHARPCPMPRPNAADRERGPRDHRHQAGVRRHREDRDRDRHVRRLRPARRDDRGRRPDVRQRAGRRRATCRTRSRTTTRATMDLGLPREQRRRSRSTSRITGRTTRASPALGERLHADLAVLLRQPVPVSLASPADGTTFSLAVDGRARRQDRGVPDDDSGARRRATRSRGRSTRTRSSTSARRPRARSSACGTGRRADRARPRARSTWSPRSTGWRRRSGRTGSASTSAASSVELAARRVRRHGAPSVLAHRVGRDRRRGDERPRGGARLVRRRHPHRVLGGLRAQRGHGQLPRARARSMSWRRRVGAATWKGYRPSSTRVPALDPVWPQSCGVVDVMKDNLFSRRRTCAARSSTRASPTRSAPTSSITRSPRTSRRTRATTGIDAGDARHDQAASRATTRPRARRCGSSRRRACRRRAPVP